MTHVFPPPRLLEQLSASRFLVDRAEPSAGIGERRSKTKGMGLEFADYRPYQQGDDVRHVDARLMARLGEAHVRQYLLDRQLPITIVVDASASMLYGTPDKYAYASMLAHVFAFIGLTSGDLVQAGVFGGGKLHLSPKVHGVGRADILFAWLNSQNTGGARPFTSMLEELERTLRPQGLLILISDWWGPSFERELDVLATSGQEILAIHVVAPEEIDPAALGTGAHGLIDIETGEEIDVMLNTETVALYQAAFAKRCESLKAGFRRRQGRYFQVSSSVDIEAFFLRELRGRGVIA